MINNQLIFLFAFFGGYALLIILCEWLNRKRHVDSEYTRKFAHIVSSLSVLLFPLVFADIRYVLILCVTFFITLLVANQMNIFHSIDGVGRRTSGSYLLALSVGISYYISVRMENSMLYTLPILILAISDPLAGVIGKWALSKHILSGKTVAGSLTFLISSLIICLIYLTSIHYEHVYRLSAIIAFCATVAELLSPRGTDNLTIPLTISGILILG